jgi:hypothetical protein
VDLDLRAARDVVGVVLFHQRHARACAAAVCHDGCLYEATSYLWPASVCSPGATDGGLDASATDATSDTGDLAGSGNSPRSGCAYRMEKPGSDMSMGWILAAAIGVAWSVLRSRSIKRHAQGQRK